MSYKELFEQNGFSLTETTSVELKVLRKFSKEFCLVLKEGDNLYYSSYQEGIVPFVRKNFEHQCVHGLVCCHRLSAAPDEYGGCRKVRNKATGIEDFDFIKVGVETFNDAERDIMIVQKCSNYYFVKEDPKQKKVDFGAADLKSRRFTRLYL